MKNVFKGLISASIIAIISVLSLNSCQKNVSSYSCNEDVNNWVLENKNNFKNITRDELVKLPFKYQIPLFRSFSNEKKLSIYFEKIDKILKEEMFNQIEIDFLLSLKTKLKPNIYNTDGISISTEMKNYCTESLKWTEDKYVLELEMFATEKEMREGFDLKSKTSKDKKPAIYNSPEKSDCICHYNISCLWSGERCETSVGICNKTRGGCGFFGTTNCNGLCGGNGISSSGGGDTSF